LGSAAQKIFPTFLVWLRAMAVLLADLALSFRRQYFETLIFLLLIFIIISDLILVHLDRDLLV
jgi:hypothetical protein